MTTDLPSQLSAGNNFVLYTAPNGAVKVRVLFRDESVWLTQKGLAELFGVKVPAIAKHLKNIFESGELSRVATVSKMEIVQTEADRRVSRDIEFFIYRVRQDAEYVSDFDRVVQEALRLEGKLPARKLGPGKGE